MPSDRTNNILIAGLCILILAAGAATIANPVLIEGDEGPDERLFTGPDVDDRQDPGTVEGGNGLIFGYGDPIEICVPFFAQPEVIGAIVLGALFIGAVLYLMTNGIITLALFAGFGPIIAIGWRVLTIGCDPDEEDDPDEDPEFEDGLLDNLFGEGGNETAAQVMDVATDPMVLFGAMILIGLVAFAFVLMTDDEEDEDVVEEEDGEEITIGHFDEQAIARIAGEAADRLEADDDSDIENAVYEAWRQMTGHLDIESPDTSTPGEFASEAIRVGMHPEDVMGLTGLFEEVRYGDRPPTADRESRAIEILRNIERTYSAGDE